MGFSMGHDWGQEASFTIMRRTYERGTKENQPLTSAFLLAYQLVSKRWSLLAKYYGHQRSFLDLLPPFTLSFVHKGFLFETTLDRFDGKKLLYCIVRLIWNPWFKIIYTEKTRSSVRKIQKTSRRKSEWAVWGMEMSFFERGLDSVLRKQGKL